VGGGALVAPALYVVLQVSYAQAVTLSLIYSVFTKILGFLQHLRLGNVSWRVTLLYGVAGIPGAVLGIAVALHRPESRPPGLPLLDERGARRSSRSHPTRGQHARDGQVEETP